MSNTEKASAGKASESKQRTRLTAKGYRIASNYGVSESDAGGIVTCLGCGRIFPRYGSVTGPNVAPRLARPYSEANQGIKFDNLNRARAVRHADACKGPQRLVPHGGDSDGRGNQSGPSAPRHHRGPPTFQSSSPSS